MACSSSSGCQSNCYDNGNLQAPSSQLSNSNEAVRNSSVCIKCKTKHPISTTSPLLSASHSDADSARFCSDCFRSNLYGKFRLAVISNAMISASDNVLIAFSGGTASRVALQFVHEMQLKAQKNFDASKDKSLPVFGVGVALIDESSVYQVSGEDVDKAMREITLIVSNLTPPAKQLHLVRLESVFAKDSTDAKERLTKLLDAVNDPTGKEDLLRHIRMLALQKVASENGYNRLVIGSCTSRIACDVIAAMVKGQGYSLSADIQYVDSRWKVPVVLPLRDCTEQELKLLCYLDGLKIVELFVNPISSINSLVSSFVTLLKEENPARECTIVRTAGKLTPFHFNRMPEVNDCNGSLATTRRQKKYNLNTKESISSELFCLICSSPLQNSDWSSPKNMASVNFAAVCCSSCQFQILPKDPSTIELFSSLLPSQGVVRSKGVNSCNFNLLREKIEDCLLQDSDEET